MTYLVPVKQIHLKPASLKVETSEDKGSYRIRVTSPVLARSVYLSFGSLEVNVSDNYFNLLPDETTEITATGAASLDQLRTKLQIRSLADAFPGADNR